MTDQKTSEITLSTATPSVASVTTTKPTSDGQLSVKEQVVPVVTTQPIIATSGQPVVVTPETPIIVKPEQPTVVKVDGPTVLIPRVPKRRYITKRVLLIIIIVLLLILLFMYNKDRIVRVVKG